MKTCEDCIYYVPDQLYTQQVDDEIVQDHGECRLWPHPEVTTVVETYWCGQLNEKVHVISDFPSLDKP